jgi:hypothetical protein
VGLDNPILVTIVGAVVVGFGMVGARVGGSGYSGSSSYTAVLVAADMSSTPVFVPCF